MRSDVKIGIAVGVLVVVVGLVYFIFAPDKGPKNETTDETATPVPGFGMEDESEQQPPGGAGEAAPGGRAGPETAVRTVGSGIGRQLPADGGDQLPPAGPEEVSVVSGPAGPRDTATDGTGILPRFTPGTGADLQSPPTAPVTTGGRWGTPRAGTPGEEPSELATPPAGAGFGGRVGEAVTGTRTDTSTDRTERAPSAATSRIYVVQQGDNGFWDIAEKQYGDGKYYELIAQANPDADTNSLRPGQRLILPPLPETASPSARRDELPTGAPPGSETYLVKDGDSYWSIAEAKYGNGLFHYVLEQANNVDANSLRPGMVLVIPPKPTTGPAGTTPAPSGSEAAESTIAVGPGERVYTVVAGDSYWKIAVKEYGAGRLWPAIRDANPGIDAGRMQPGQKLVIPPIELARQAIGEDASGGSTPPAGGGARPAADDRPIFD